jgi:hypothetical membrane protein
MNSLATTRRLLACGAIAGPLFVIAFLIEGATRADYSPLRHPVSSLAIGDLGWIQAVNFFVTGSLVVAFAIGVRRVLQPARWGSRLIGLVGVGLIGAGMFTSDPINGYPPGTPLFPTPDTTAGLLHVLFSVPVFVAWPIACFVLGTLFLRQHQHRLAIVSGFSGVAIVSTSVLTAIAINQVSPDLAALAGAFQRISLIVSFLWTGIVAMYLLRSTPESQHGTLAP